MPDSATVQEASDSPAAGEWTGGFSTLADCVRRAGTDRPGASALIWHDQSLTWAELDARADEVAALLRELDLPGSYGRPARVAIALPNVPEYAATLFGVLRAGLVAVPVNPGFTARELRHVLADSGAGLLVGTADVATAVAAIRDDLPALVGVHVDALPPAGVAAGSGDGGGGSPPAAPDDLAVLLYTSGTSGNPKGAMLTHGALLANHVQLARIEPAPVGPDDRLLLALPLFHAYGLNSGLGAVAFHGACGVLVERFDPADTLDLIARHQITALIGVPGMYVGWSLLPDLGEAMESVRLAVCGAAPLEAAAAERFMNATRHPVIVGYGLTETAPVLTSALVSPVPKIGSIGRPIPGVELRLVTAGGEDVWRHGDEVEPWEDDDLELDGSEPGTDPGEIVVRGPNLFAGYWPDGRDGPDPDGWWATGDVAYADEDGDLFLVDRLGELILVSGFNVYPHEVEQVIESHSGVAEAAAVGMPHPYTGQTVRAYVVRAAGSAVTAEEVLRHCERNLARFKCPTSIEFVTELPHSATGKVRKGALRRLFGGGSDQ